MQSPTEPQTDDAPTDDPPTEDFTPEELANPRLFDSFADDLKPGTELLGGHYTIEGYLNAGGFGITYLARDSIDRLVVIKECFPNALCRRSSKIVRARSRKHSADFRSLVQNFIEEARSLARLVHPNIVGVHQVFEDNDTAYMAIDYIDGKDLNEILTSSGRSFSPDEIVAMLKKMLSAVEYIHQTGMLHRDISPDNILIDQGGNPILIDFGAASEQVARATRVLTGRRVIKDGYSPQEFYVTGAAQGPSSDLYALAATFYHMIAGKAPPDSQRRLAKVAEGAPDLYEPLAGRFPGYPDGFLEAIDKAASVLPRDRISSATLWLEMIDPEAAGLVEDTPPAPTPARRGRAKPARGGSGSSLATIGGGVAALILVVGLWLGLG